MDDNRWHHVVGVRDSRSMKILIYVDGRKEREVYCPGEGQINSAAGVVVGNQRHLSGGTGHCGYLDEVIIWNRALSESEIKQLYDSQR